MLRTIFLKSHITKKTRLLHGSRTLQHAYCAISSGYFFVWFVIIFLSWKKLKYSPRKAGSALRGYLFLDISEIQWFPHILRFACVKIRFCKLIMIPHAMDRQQPRVTSKLKFISWSKVNFVQFNSNQHKWLLPQWNFQWADNVQGISDKNSETEVRSRSL